MSERLGHALERALAQLGLKQAADRQSAVRLWDEVAGPHLREHAQAVAVRGEVLEVVVADSAWANQVALLKQELLDRLNARLAPERLKDLRVRVGRVRPPEAERAGDVLARDEIELAKRDLRRILEEEETSLAADLRAALLEFAARAEARRRRREGRSAGPARDTEAVASDREG